MLMGDAQRWILSTLFGAGIATYVYILVAQRGRWTSTVNHLLHLAMSVAMILMAWGVAMNLPTSGFVIFFLLAGAWFAGLAGQRSSPGGDRLTNGYYAVMMVAMAWMFVAMNGGLPIRLGHSSDHAEPPAAAMDMPADAMPAHEMPPAEPPAEWIATVNVIAALGFAIVTLYWVCRYVARRKLNAVPRTGRLAHFEPLYQACAAAGTALMFGTLL